MRCNSTLRRDPGSRQGFSESLASRLSTGGPITSGSRCQSVNNIKPETLEPIRQGVGTVFGGCAAAVAAGLALRHDHGSQYMSDHFPAELTFLGIASSPAFVREPEGNGCAERFIRTLKEHLLWVRTFDTVEESRVALLEFKARYNREWLIERHGHQTPAAVRAAFTVAVDAVA
jgi:transposase InsO family protein